MTITKPETPHPASCSCEACDCACDPNAPHCPVHSRITLDEYNALLAERDQAVSRVVVMEEVQRALVEIAQSFRKAVLVTPPLLEFDHDRVIIEEIDKAIALAGAK